MYWNFWQQVETPSVSGTIKIPIAVLKVGDREQRVVQSNLEFPEGPVTFKLLSGSGPVIITGLLAPPETNADEPIDAIDAAGEEEMGDEEEVIFNYQN